VVARADHVAREIDLVERDFQLGLVIPAYNEQERLPETLGRLSSWAQAENIALHLVVVDDGSTDQTAESVAGWNLEPDGVRVDLVRIEHQGKGAAVRAGISLLDATVVGYCDADLSAGPDAIAAVRGVIAQGADVAMASRGLHGSVLLARQARPREWAGKLFNYLLRLTTGLSFRDTQCGLKLFSRRAANEIFRYQRLDGFAFDTEVIVLASRLGFRVVEVPIRWAHAPGSKVSMLRDSMRMARDLVRIVRRLRRSAMVSPGVPDLVAAAQMVEVEENHWWHQAKRQIVTELSVHAPKGPLLDVGCGGGAALATLGRDRTAIGVDLSLEILRMAGSRNQLDLVQAEAAKLPFATESFSLVLALDSLEHHPNAARMLREIHEVLATHGILIVTVPAYGWMWSYADHLLGHYRRYTRKQLVRELTEAGFRIERATYFHSWLLPIAWVFRRVKGALGKVGTTDDFPVRPALNSLLFGITRAELKLLLKTNVPFGLSIVATARRI
jgi:dolichyl-phosphate beta-glucosyltransferase